jgi:hypothetical protein
VNPQPPGGRHQARRRQDTAGVPMNGHPGGVFAGYRHLDASQAVARGDVPSFPALVTAGDATPKTGPSCTQEPVDLRPGWLQPAGQAAAPLPVDRHNGTAPVRDEPAAADIAADRAAAELKDWLSDAGTFVVAGTAGFSSWAGWVSLGRSVGWGSVGVVELAWLLPVSVDVYAFVALRTWNNARLPEATRTVGKVSAIGALALSIAGNAAGHAVEAGTFAPNWIVVVLVASLAPILLFLTLHLRVLRTRDQAAAARAARERAERKAARSTATTERDAAGQTGRHRQTSRPNERSAAHARASRPTARSARSPKTRPSDDARPVDSTDQSNRPTAKADDHELVEQILRLDAERGRPAGRDLIAARLHVGSGRASRLRQLADAQADQDLPDRTDKEAGG